MPLMQLDCNINVLTKDLCCKNLKNELQFILHLNHPDFNLIVLNLSCFTIIFEQCILNISGLCNSTGYIHPIIVLFLFT